MLSAENIQFNSLDSLWAIDANKMEITRWKISPSTRSAERVEEIKLDKELVRSLDFHTMESGFFIPDYMGEFRYWEVGNNGKPLKSIGEIPSATIDENTVRPALAQACLLYTSKPRALWSRSSCSGVYSIASRVAEQCKTIRLIFLMIQFHLLLI